MMDLLLSDSGLLVALAAGLAMGMVGWSVRTSRRATSPIVMPRSTGVVLLVAFVFGLAAAASARSVVMTIMSLGAVIAFGVLLAGSVPRGADDRQ